MAIISTYLRKRTYSSIQSVYYLVNYYSACWIQGLIAQKIMGLSQYFHTSLQTLIFAVFNGTSLISIGCRVQEILHHELTHQSQIHETWVRSSNLMGLSRYFYTPSIFAVSNGNFLVPYFRDVYSHHYRSLVCHESTQRWMVYVSQWVDKMCILRFQFLFEVVPFLRFCHIIMEKIIHCLEKCKLKALHLAK